MADLPFDAQERRSMADLLAETGPDAPTLLDGWVARDLAAHLVLREHDLVAAPGLVIPGRWARFAERRRVQLAQRSDYAALVDQVRSGPPRGFFRVSWVRSLANLNEFFVHHEDLRRANGLGERDDLEPALQAALWRNVNRSRTVLCRRLRNVGLELVWSGRDRRIVARRGDPVVQLHARPGELLLYLFGRGAVANVELTGPASAREQVHATHFGM